VGQGRSSKQIVHDVALGGDLEAASLWDVGAHGRSGQRAWIRAHVSSVYLSDGWGVSPASLRFRRLDAITGEEIASFRSGTAVRALAFRESTADLLVATDSKLFELDSLSLAESRRWDSRIPRYADSMAVRGDHVVVANWLTPSIGIIDLVSARVRRKASAGMTRILDGAGSPLLVGGLDGGVLSIEPTSGLTHRMIETPAALDAGLSPDGRTLWLAVGVRAIVASTGARGGDPTRELRRYALDGSETPATYRVPAPIQRVAVGTTSLWLVGERLLVLPLPIGTGPARTWAPPDGQTMVDVEPDAGLVVTQRPGGPDVDARVACFRILD
jgi:hypothetical protein